MPGTTPSPLFDASQTRVSLSPIDDPRILSGNFWGELRVFLAVAKAKSFSRASTQCGLSGPSARRAIDRLESELRCQLLTVSNNGVALTARGKEMAQQLVALDQRLFAISKEFRAERSEEVGTVGVACTEALGALFIVPSLPEFGKRHSRIQVHIKNPVSLLNYKENFSDIVVGFGPLLQAGIVSKPCGFLHLLPIAARTYLERAGVPQWDNLVSHHFLDAGYYASNTPIYARWRQAVDHGSASHIGDSPFVYGLMVKAGLGIGLLGNFTLADRDVIPVDLGIHIKLPIHISAQKERLETRPVKAVFDHLSEVFSVQNPLLAPDLDLQACHGNSLSQSFERIMAGTGFVHASDSRVRGSIVRASGT